MPQTHADPDELERFAQILKQFHNDLSNRTTALKQQFARLENTWHDQEHSRFAQEFQQTTAILERFIHKAEADVSFLMKKASILRDFLNQR
jgi:uncharacterized protein YukE